MNEIPQTILATLALYRDCATAALQGVIRNWVIHLGTAAAVIAIFVGANIAGMAGAIVGGFLQSVLMIVLLTLYYSWIDETAERSAISFRSLLDFDVSMFFSIISVGFVLWIIDIIANAAEVAAIGHLVGLMLIVLCNPLPELIQRHRTDGMSGLSAGFAFMKENWIEWLIPAAFFLSPLFIQFGDNALLYIASRDFWQGVLLPILPIARSAALIAPALPEPVLLVLLLLISNWYMLFRAHLYRGLTGGSRRKRVYEMRAK